MTTKITPSVLENTAVTPTTYGTASQVPTVTVDAQGRITGASNTSIAIGTSQITSGTLADDRLPGQASLTAANYYGSASNIAQIVTDAKGRVKSATNVAIQIATSQITGYPSFATSATTDTSNASNISTGTLPDARLSNAGTNSGSFGSASAVPAITVDTKGRVTAVTSTNIAIGSGAVSGLATSATTDTTNADNITTGTLATARLSSVAVNIGQFGSASQTPRITVNAKGQVTDLSVLNIAIGAGAVSGLATVATSGAYGDLSGRPTIPTIPTSLPASDVSAWAKAATKPSYAYSELSSLPTIPSNTNQLTNGAGFITSAEAAAATPATTGVGAILALFWASLSGNSAANAAKTFMGNTIPGSQLYYCPFYGDTDSGYSHWRLSGGMSQTFYTLHDSESTLVMPWNDPRGVTFVSGTWRVLSAVVMSAHGASGYVFNYNALFQRIS